MKGIGTYTDDELWVLAKITVEIAADYLGISPMMVTLGMRNSVLPINFAIKKRIGAAKAGAAISLLERLSAYHHGKNACRIHAYVSVMEKAHSEQALSASWARAKADWYDPVIAKEDDLLDRWEHEKNQENKGPRRKGYRW